MIDDGSLAARPAASLTISAGRAPFACRDILTGAPRRGRSSGVARRPLFATPALLQAEQAR